MTNIMAQNVKRITPKFNLTPQDPKTQWNITYLTICYPIHILSREVSPFHSVDWYLQSHKHHSEISSTMSITRCSFTCSMNWGERGVWGGGFHMKNIDSDWPPHPQLWTTQQVGRHHRQQRAGSSVSALFPLARLQTGAVLLAGLVAAWDSDSGILHSL